VDSCSVSAQWNWWGATTGPTVNGNGNGDQLNSIRNGLITYAPWHRLPVLFSGILRFILTNIHQKNSMGQQFTIPEKMSDELYQNSSDHLAIHGMKNIRIGREQSVLPMRTLEKNFFPYFLNLF
jgi:hypothetical protein